MPKRACQQQDNCFQLSRCLPAQTATQQERSDRVRVRLQKNPPTITRRWVMVARYREGLVRPCSLLILQQPRHHPQGSRGTSPRASVGRGGCAWSRGPVAWGLWSRSAVTPAATRAPAPRGGGGSCSVGYAMARSPERLQSRSCFIPGLYLATGIGRIRTCRGSTGRPTIGLARATATRQRRGSSRGSSASIYEV